jgi:Bacterial Ig domain
VSRIITRALPAVLACAAALAASASATPPDTTPPSVSWQNDDLHGIVAGTRTLTVDVSDDIGVAAVQFDIAGSRYAVATDNHDGSWSAPFDSASVPEGSVTITAVASDAAGNHDSADISFTDSHDAIAPTISASSPADSDSVDTVTGTSLPVSGPTSSP